MGLSVAVTKINIPSGDCNTFLDGITISLDGGGTYDFNYKYDAQYFIDGMGDESNAENIGNYWIDDFSDPGFIYFNSNDVNNIDFTDLFTWIEVNNQPGSPPLPVGLLEIITPPEGIKTFKFFNLEFDSQNSYWKAEINQISGNNNAPLTPATHSVTIYPYWYYLRSTEENKCIYFKADFNPRYTFCSSSSFITSSCPFINE
jgi:hypothetical protein